MKPRHPTLLTIFLVVFVDLVGFGIVLPLLQFAGKDYGASGWLVGIIIGSYSLMQFLFAPIWGKLSDRWGRRPVLLFSLAASAGSYTLFALSDGWQMLLISRILAGVFGANVAVAQAYIADITPPESRSKGMGLVGMAFGLGFIFGPVIGGISLGNTQSYALPGWIAAGLCGLNFIMALLFLPESLSREHRSGAKPFGNCLPWAEILAPHRSKAMMTLLMVTLFTNIAFTIWETTFGLWLHVNPSFGYAGREFSFLLVYVGLITSCIQGGMIGRLARRYGEIHLVRAGNFFLALGVGLIPVSANLGVLLLVLGCLAIGNGVNRPATYGLASLLSTKSEQGAVLGAIQSASSFARIIGPPIGGSLLDVHRHAPYAAATLSLVVASWLLLGLKTQAAATNPTLG
jgi:DHA1 family tetracycline resistance protein-like MFS transporter